MDHLPSNSKPQTCEKEIAILCVLCAPNTSGDTRKHLIAILRDYEWLDADHRETFEAANALLLRQSREILPHLHAELTRRGFPDISCDWLAESAINDADALRCAEELRRAQAVRR